MLKFQGQKSVQNSLSFSREQKGKWFSLGVSALQTIQNEYQRTTTQKSFIIC